MVSSSRGCLSIWKVDLNHKQYGKVVYEVSAIAAIYSDSNDKNWLETFEALIKKVNEMSNRMMWENVKKYLKDFFNDAIQVIKGEMTNTKFRNKTRKTLELLKKAYSS